MRLGLAVLLLRGPLALGADEDGRLQGPGWHSKVLDVGSLARFLRLMRHLAETADGERGASEGESSSCVSRRTHLSLALAGEQLADFLLLVNVVFLQELLVKPVGVPHTGHRILHLAMRKRLISRQVIIRLR